MTAPIDEATRDRVEAAAFRRLTALLRHRTDVQNVDLMGVGGFCRNCLSRLGRRSGSRARRGDDQGGRARMVYGMPYAEYKARHQTDATPEQLAAMAASVAKNRALDEALADSFPASDPPSASEPGS